MWSSRSLFLLIASHLWLGSFLAAQQPAQPTAEPAVDNQFVQKQFGSTCSLIGVAPMAADLDGDGVDDLVIPARCTNPMVDQAENNFVVVDPYNSFFGYGNPKVTTQFSSEDPERRGYVLLVIHGAGAEAWHATTPKAKFILVNLPFRQVMVKKVGVGKKKTVLGIYAEETDGSQTTSVTYWDGKKYRYLPMGASMQ